MSVRKSFDHRLNDWLDEGPQVAPHDLLHAVLEELPSHRQERHWLFGGRWRIPMLTFARLGVAAIAVAVVAVAFIATRPAPSVGTGPTATPASSSVFTSKLYAYSISVPPGWTATGAGTRWSGIGSPTVQDITVDLIDSPDAVHGAAVLVFAAPTSKSLAAYVAAGIATNYVVHRQDGCPEQPESVESVTVGGEPAKFVSWNCGVLINVAFTVHAGQGYWFVFRDYGVHAATDPVDKGTFTAMLASVRFK